MMARVRLPLIIALVATALLLLAFGATALVSFLLWFRYRNAPGLGAIRSATQIAAGLAALGLLATMAIIDLATALQPAGRWRKLLYVLPSYLLGFTLVGVALYLLKIGTVGIFTTTWLGVGTLLSLIATLIAAARMQLGDQTARNAMRAIGFTGVPALLTWLGVVISIVIVLTSQPSAFPGGSGFGQGGQGQPPSAGTPTSPNNAAGPGDQFRPGGPDEQFGPGGPGGRGSSTTPLMLGGALMTLFALGLGLSLSRGLRAARTPADAPAAPQPAGYRHEASQALFSCVAITIVALAVAQVVPVRRDNPPTQTAIKWDSTQTQSLAQRACMDCHSNETRWPWYAYVAPGSWLLRDHVSTARAQFNMSALGGLPAFRAQRLPEEVGQQIRSGAMPPADYLILHPDARLSDAERSQLIQGLGQSLTNTLNH